MPATSGPAWLARASDVVVALRRSEAVGVVTPSGAAVLSVAEASGVAEGRGVDPPDAEVAADAEAAPCRWCPDLGLRVVAAGPDPATAPVAVVDDDGPPAAGVARGDGDADGVVDAVWQPAGYGTFAGGVVEPFSQTQPSVEPSPGW
jgi:hypothetical protein